MYHEQCPLNGGEFYCVLYKKFHCCNRFTLHLLLVANMCSLALFLVFKQSDPPASMGRTRDWNVDLVPKFIMANGKEESETVVASSCLNRLIKSR